MGGFVMFDVILDCQVDGVRERAKGGNFDSMVALASFIQLGKHTRRNENQALQILDYVLENREKVPLPKTVWDAICWKVHLIDNDQTEQLYLDLIQNMTSFPVSKWNFRQLEDALTWLEQKHLDCGTSI